MTRIVRTSAILLAASAATISDRASAQLAGDGPAISHLERAEAAARERQFFGRQGYKRASSSYFQRARDLTNPYSGGRFSPQSLATHDYGNITRTERDSLGLRALTDYYDLMAQRTSARASAQKSTAVTAPAPDYSQSAERMQLANQLNLMGHAFKWQEHSLNELQGIASRIDKAERLRAKGINVEWSNYSSAELSDIGHRAAMAEQMMQQGRQVDWTGYLRLAPQLSSYGPLPPQSPGASPTSTLRADIGVRPASTFGPRLIPGSIPAPAAPIGYNPIR